MYINYNFIWDLSLKSPIKILDSYRQKPVPHRDYHFLNYKLYSFPLQIFDKDEALLV
jgi:hypothetical protein